MQRARCRDGQLLGGWLFDGLCGPCSLAVLVGRGAASACFGQAHHQLPALRGRIRGSCEGCAALSSGHTCGLGVPARGMCGLPWAALLGKSHMRSISRLHAINGVDLFDVELGRKVDMHASVLSREAGLLAP